jgi:hypothetical protein
MAFSKLWLQSFLLSTRSRAHFPRRAEQTLTTNSLLRYLQDYCRGHLPGELVPGVDRLSVHTDMSQPLGVFLERGCGADLLINVLLTSE